MLTQFSGLKIIAKVDPENMNKVAPGSDRVWEDDEGNGYIDTHLKLAIEPTSYEKLFPEFALPDETLAVDEIELLINHNQQGKNDPDKWEKISLGRHPLVAKITNSLEDASVKPAKKAFEDRNTIEIPSFKWTRRMKKNFTKILSSVQNSFQDTPLKQDIYNRLTALLDNAFEIKGSVFFDPTEGAGGEWVVNDTPSTCRIK